MSHSAENPNEFSMLKRERFEVFAIHSYTKHQKNEGGPFGVIKIFSQKNEK